MKQNIVILFFLLLFQNISAQLNIGGNPYGFDTHLNLKSENELPRIYLEKSDNKALREEAIRNDAKDKPWQFGKNIAVNIDIKKFAVVENLPEGKLYRLIIISENALTINLKFSTFIIPDKSVLYIYNYEKTDVLGGFTSENNQKSKTFATSLIRGDEIVIEYFEPNNADFSGELILGRVTHGFRGVGDMIKGFGNSGDCNMNVACDDGTYSDQIRSVCMLVTGGSGFCSGALINNTKDDGKPYILTANHCYENPADLVFWFNWQSATCDNPSISPNHNDLSGAVLRAKDYESDFCLFEMNDIPPYTYNVYYSGWNNEDVPSVTSVSVHHPSADIKKISYDDDSSVSDYYLGNSSSETSHWKVVWDRNTTTEGGSSGSPLFNQNGLIIGQLHGGYASCLNLTEPDWYGKISYSWDTGAAPETRLKDWLDPLNLNIAEYPGYDPNLPVADYDAQMLTIISPEKYYYGKNRFTPSFKIRNRGNQNLTSVTVTCKIDDTDTKSKQWTGNLATGEIAEIKFDEILLPFAKHTIKVWTSNPDGFTDEYRYNDTVQMTFYIYEIIFEDNFENGNTWELSGEFQIGNPEGLGGEKGYPDPLNAFSGNNILGTDLTGLGNNPGGYENNIGYEDEYAVSPVIDCRNYENVQLSFQRQLGVDQYRFDKVSIEIQNDTDDRINIWRNYNTVITDSIWTKQTFDISEYADNQKIKIRFSLGPTDYADRYCGWNIDDFMISGTEVANSEQPESNISVYPNPADNYFYVEFLNKEKFLYADIIVSDLSGKIIFRRYFSENEIKNINTSVYDKQLIKIDLPQRSIGLFLVRVITDKGRFIGKLTAIPVNN